MNTIALSYKKRLARYPEEDEAERWDGVALDFYLRTGAVPDEVLHFKALALAGVYARKYREDQPRVPERNPDGGQWTVDGGRATGESGDDLPIEPASLRDKARAVERVTRALRNWWRADKVPKPYDAAKDPLTPNGELIGAKGKGRDVRTVSPDEFRDLKSKLMSSAKELPRNERYDGKIYERQDGTQFGLRNSKSWDEAIDIFKSPNPKIESGTKVHQLWPST